MLYLVINVEAEGDVKPQLIGAGVAPAAASPSVAHTRVVVESVDNATLHVSHKSQLILRKCGLHRVSQGMAIGFGWGILGTWAL